MPWRPPTETTRYDTARVARLDPVARALNALKLPPAGDRKLGTILNALEMQIEDGGDHPEVNRLLIEALRAGVRHYVSERRARRVFAALDDLEAAEVEHWDQMRAGTLPSLDSLPENRLDDLMQEGYRHRWAGHGKHAADVWLKAWALVLELATPEMRTVEAFDARYPDLTESVFNWTSDLEEVLRNEGLSDPAYFRHQVRFVDEFLAQFPEVSDLSYVQMLRAKGEALFRLGRQEEGDAVYRDLIARSPDEGWAHIGWSDNYAFGFGIDRDIDRAEQILLEALKRPKLRDRVDALDRLATLYGESEQTEAYARTVAQLPADRRREVEERLSHRKQRREPVKPIAAQEKPGRNDPCWCGSGKKYKDCHWREDRLS